MKAISTQKISKYFGGVHAVDRVSITIQQGIITGIIGPNGSGKTTYINLLSGLTSIDDGSFSLYEDVTLSKIYPHHIHTYGITRTFQSVRVFEQMSVLDNVLVVLTERNVFSALFEKHSDFHQSQAEIALTTVGLWDKQKDLAADLSYGQRRLLEMARVIAIDADIILLDEPFSGLFPQMIKQVSAIIQSFKSAGKTIILIEHNMDLIRELSDYVFVMDSGHILTEGKPDEVLSDRRVVNAYLGE